jgi:hypothetical protein
VAKNDLGIVLTESLTRSEMMGNLKEDDIQKLHTTAPEQLTDQELLLSTISAADLARKHSGGWDKEHPKCLFCSKAYRGTGLLQSSVT